MNSVLMQRSELSGVHFVKPRHTLLPSKNLIPGKSFFSACMGLILSAALYCVLSNKGLLTQEMPKIPMSANQALYQWKGFYRVGLDIR